MHIALIVSLWMLLPLTTAWHARMTQDLDGRPRQTQSCLDGNDLSERSEPFCQPAASNSKPGPGHRHYELRLLFWQNGCQVINFGARCIVSSLFIHAIIILFSSAFHCILWCQDDCFMFGPAYLHCLLLSKMDPTEGSAKTITHDTTHALVFLISLRTLS